MKRFLEIISLVFAAFFGLVFLFFLGAGLWTQFYGKFWLEKQIERVSHLHVSIGSLGSNYFNTLTARNVILEKPFPVTLTSAQLSFQPWEFLNPKRAYRNVFFLRINGMTCSLSDETDFSFLNKSSSFTLPRVPVTMLISNSSVAVTLDGRLYSVENLSAEVKATPDKIKLVFDSNRGTAGPFQGHLSYAPGNKKMLSDISFENLEVSLAEPFLPDSTKSQWGSLAGKTSLRVSVQDKQHYKVEAKASSLQWTPVGKSEQVPLSIDLSANPASLTVNSLEVDHQFSVKGSVKDYLHMEPQLDLTFQADEASIKRLAYFFSKGNIALSDIGMISISGNLKGTMNNPDIEGNLSADVSIGNMVLPELKGNFVVQNHEYNLSTIFSGGDLNITGKWANNQILQSKLELKNVALDQIADINNWKNVKGKINSRLNLEWGNRANPRLNGPLSLEGFSWGRINTKKNIHGTLVVDEHQFLLSASDDGLVINISRDKDRINLDTVKLAFDKDSVVLLRGTIQSDNRQVNCSVSGQNIPADLWPPLVEKYPEIEGGGDVEGTVFGRVGSLEADLNLIFHGLKFQSTGEAWNGSGTLLWSPSQMTLKNIQVDGGYSGDLSLMNQPSNDKLSLNITLENARPELFRDVLGSSVSVTGLLSGFLNATLEKGFVTGHSSITWQNGSVSSVPFELASVDVAMNQSHLTLQDLTFIWNDQTLRGYGTVAPQNNGTWVYEANLQAQQVGPPAFKLDGEIQASGNFSVPQKTIRGKLHSSTFWLNGSALDEFKMNFEEDGSWFSLQGSAAPFASFNGRWSAQTGKIKGDLIGKSLKLDEIISKYFSTMGLKQIPAGSSDVKLSVSGTLKDPLVKASISIPHAVWRGETLSAEAFLDITRSTVTIKTSETRLATGGLIYAGGTIELTGSQAIDIEGAGSNLALASLFHLIDWPLNWKGQANSKFSVKGEQGNKKVEFAFNGTHEGFPPFSGGGEITGRALWENGEWNLDGLTIGMGNGFVKLLKGSRIFPNKNNSGVMRLVADTRNLRAGPLTFFGGLEVTGEWQGPRGTFGAEDHSPVEMDVFARSLWVNQILLNGNVTHLKIQPHELEFSPIVNSEQKISGILDYKNSNNLKLIDFRLIDNGVERFYIDGDIGKEAWDFSLRAKEIEASLVRGLFDTTLSMSGPMDIAIQGTGSLHNPALEGTISWHQGTIADIPVDSANCEMKLNDGIVHLEKLVATRKKGYQIKGNLTFGTDLQGKDQPDPPQFDFVVENGDLALLKDIWGEVTSAKGSFEGHLKLKNDLEGGFTLKNANFRTESYIPSLKNGVLVLDLKNNVMTVREGTAKLNQGVIQLSGEVRFDEGSPSSYNLKLKTLSEEGVSVRVPELTIPPGAVLGRFNLLRKKLGGISRGDPLINLSMTGPDEGPTLAGKVLLENAVFTYPGSPDRKKPPATQFSRWRQRLVARMNWDVNIKAGKRTRYENELVEAAVNGDINFQGPTSDLSVNGRINSDLGSLIYSGSEFKLNNANLEINTSTIGFQTSKQTFVYLKASAERDVFYSDSLGNGNQDTIVMEVDRALLGEVQPRFYSKTNPNISPEKALKLALGLDTYNPSGQGSSFLGAASKQNNQGEIDRALRLGLVQLLDSNLATPMARAIARQTGLVDYIRVTYQQEDSTLEGIAPSETSPTAPNNVSQNDALRYVKGTKVKLGREISRRLFADYSFKVDEFENQVDLKHQLELAYRVRKNLFLRATSELDTERTLGRPPDRRAVLENRWRFGLPRKKKIAPNELPQPTESESPATPIKE